MLRRGQSDQDLRQGCGFQVHRAVDAAFPGPRIIAPAAAKPQRPGLPQPAPLTSRVIDQDRAPGHAAVQRG
jgi:hypothetical protein